MAKVDRLISHMQTKAKKLAAGKQYKRQLTNAERQLSRADQRLIRIAAEELTGMKKRRRWRHYKKKLPTCAAYISNKSGVRKCYRLAGKSGYCLEHETGGNNGHSNKHEEKTKPETTA